MGPRFQASAWPSMIPTAMDINIDIATAVLQTQTWPLAASHPGYHHVPRLLCMVLRFAWPQWPYDPWATTWPQVSL